MMKNLKFIPEELDNPSVSGSSKTWRFINNFEIVHKKQSPMDSIQFEKAILDDCGEKVLGFISEQINLSNSNSTLLTLRDSFFHGNNDSKLVRNIVNLGPINTRKNLNEYFRTINSLLPDAGIYIGCYEDYLSRKKRILKNYPPKLRATVLSFDFIVHRVIPKLSFSGGIYNFFFRGKNRAISKAETLGRLCYNGFEVITDERIGNMSYFTVMKTGEPKKQTNISYGPLFKMNRIGKDGKMIGVYKIRTMHPYSEFLQNYVVSMNGYDETGKPSQDFRVTDWSKIVRKLHLDEVPQLLNVLKGELNIVGVRPLSRFGFESLPPDLQKERIKYKAGCLPPNVALGMSGFNEVIWAERLYLRKMKKNTYLTNFRFFFMAIYNLLRRKTTSA
jgi:lipopolysaccharide/colanic/teichoic acid biosynthesis glycosyltransferase